MCVGDVYFIFVLYTVLHFPVYHIRCLLDFGNINSLGKASNSLYLKVTNDTAIPTSLVAHVVHFPSTVTCTDPPTTKADKNTLLRQTANLYFICVLVMCISYLCCILFFTFQSITLGVCLTLATLIHLAKLQTPCISK